MSIIVHQALYGYQEGHWPLASSLPRQDRYRHHPLVEACGGLSDLSGYVPYGVQWDWYSQGFPLGSHYVFMRSWNDVDGPRGGCVLTHALFVPMDVAIELPRHEFLAPLYRRPQRPDWSPYTQPLELSTDWPEPKPVGGKEPLEVPQGQRERWVDWAAQPLSEAVATWVADRTTILWTRSDLSELSCATAWEFLEAPERRPLRASWSYCGFALGARTRRTTNGPEQFSLLAMAPEAQGAFWGAKGTKVPR